MTRNKKEKMFTAARMAVLVLIVGALCFIGGSEFTEKFLLCIGMPCFFGGIFSNYLDRQMDREIAEVNKQRVGLQK